jgi:FkbM family methyltransferase
MQTSAQNKEDLVLIRYFDGKHDGVFVDVGAHDGVQFSNTYLLEKHYGWSGVCIEPNPESFEKLVENRPNARCFKVASVNHDPRLIELLVPNGTPVLGSTRPTRDGIAQILNIPADNVNYNKYTVQATRLGNTLYHYWHGFPANYDLLSIDTEWTELEVMKSADLSKYSPEVIVVEANNKEYAEKIEDYLTGEGYYRCGIVGGINYFYVREKANVDRMKEAITHVASSNSANVR